MGSIKIQDRFLKGFIEKETLNTQLQAASKAREILHAGSGKGSDFLGWVNLPFQIDSSLLQDIEADVQKLKAHSEYLVVVGIGGSYLGAKAIIEANSKVFESSSKGLKVLYAGHHLDSDYHVQLLDFLKDKDFSVNVISKSGTTTEPALAFRSLLNLLQKKYGKDKIQDRVISTTDAKKGALKKLSDELGFKTYVIPDDVGGRYSVLTPVGLLPIAAAGIDIRGFVEGAKSMAKELKETHRPENNLACVYAAYRNALYQSGKKVEILVNYNPALLYVSEWWKQLYGESEGKDGKGIFPASVNFTTDLHSLGQYIQEGERFLFETVLEVGSPKEEQSIEEVAGDPDGLNYLSGKTLSYVNSRAIEGTKLAHYEGGVPIIEMSVPSLNPEVCGELVYMFEYGCGVSGYMLDVNPFDQPGVEGYKNNMFALLGKKGYEAMKAEVEGKLKKLS
ncbi:MAG: glucose-6-phosphate isomerase [Leptospiraceae bacterium]|nr:glucose-6-phosphate isomerase [Leptospiraceae bacterium]MCP5501161.1 glucose-6-phosphate isomerase [Leptospiraceae bacterium]